ncbi:GTP-binding protein REM 2-like isoform X2 [Syngnathoides biaculeatus]|uniref:GTP-binding protein REM 2-like isoform X2 n=1 Tax=Syngnathoides biaculeatus TaxID=300417 RepID=UPI002ADD5CB7|nr:GTP-binding protein REM 2-like isoform X2 [Syngnathoides biaculeatus]
MADLLYILQHSFLERFFVFVLFFVRVGPMYRIYSVNQYSRAEFLNASKTATEPSGAASVRSDSGFAGARRLQGPLREAPLRQPSRSADGLRRQQQQPVFTAPRLLPLSLQMPTDVPQDALKTEEDPLKSDPMTLSSTPTVRRGSTPLPVKHQLRREEAVHDDCDWSSDAACHASAPPPVRIGPAPPDAEAEGGPDGPLRIALLGQNGVGKSSLAFALAGDADTTASVDSDGEGHVSAVTVDDEESTVVIYDNWRHDLSSLRCEVCVLVFSVTDRRSFHRTAQLRLLLRETQPQTPIILVGNKSDLVRSREVTAQACPVRVSPQPVTFFHRSPSHASSSLTPTDLIPNPVRPAHSEREPQRV